MFDWGGARAAKPPSHLPPLANQKIENPLQEVLASFHCPLEAVRLLKLTAGSSIREHRDYKLGYEDGVLRFHIPVITSPDVAFFLEGRQIVMNPGECWYLNLNLPHHVDNHSTVDRIHLVIDAIVNDWVHDLLAPVSAA